MSFLSLLFMFSPALAQQPVLVKDINGPTAETRSLAPQQLINRNGTLYFVGNSETQGRELWKSNGTAAGTTLVKDITPGAGNSDISGLTLVNGTLYFAAQGELWKSDGTAAGTVRVLKLYPSAAANPSSLVSLNGTLYFSASDGSGTDLWRSDGTAAGTTLVKSFPDYNYPLVLVSAGGALYCATADDYPAQLWKSNGTPAGTVELGGFRVLKIEDMIAVNGTVFFTAYGLGEGIELWKSNGTAAGTVLVKDIDPGYLVSEWGTPYREYNHSVPRDFTNVNGTVFFTASDTNGRAVWKSDGTDAGTVRVSPSFPLPNSDNFSPADLTNVNGTLYFGAVGDLWKSNGTPAGTAMLKDIGTGAVNPFHFTAINGTVYFTAADAAGTSRLWKTNGTANGTVSVADSPASPANLTNVNGTLYFSGTGATVGNELWKVAAPAVAGTFRVNAGGSSRSTADGRNFAADAYFSGGVVSTASTAGIGGTADDYLYQTGRHGSSFAYNFPTGNGSYDVVLHFAETYWGSAAAGGAGSRRFHVNLEGVRKLTDYDIFVRAGGALRVAQ
ncbi:MAG: hypothetical protein ICV83_11155, partial [Cytophagales bacterium]|nr:hypothetical protein [Cytophagales bacterium]